MDFLTRIVGDAVVRFFGLLLDLVAPGRDRSHESVAQQPEATTSDELPDSATLVERFRALREAGSALSSQTGALAAAPSAAPVSSPNAGQPPGSSGQSPTPPTDEASGTSPSESGAAQVSTAHTVAPSSDQKDAAVGSAAARTDTTSPANPQDEQSATADSAQPATPSAAHESVQVPGGGPKTFVDRTQFEQLHLHPTPPPALSEREQALELSPGRRGMVDQDEMKKLLAAHASEPQVAHETAHSEGLPLSPGRSGTVNVQEFHATKLAEATPRAQDDPRWSGLPHSPVVVAAAGAGAAPHPSAAPAPAPASTAETALAKSTWPELPPWPPEEWDAPIARREPLRESVEAAWYV